MKKVIIYVKQHGGRLEYRDSESHHGKTITTTVDPGNTLIWKLDQCSGISEIKDIKISGAKDFLSKGPEKTDFNEWQAEVNPHGITGHITYQIKAVFCKTEGKEMLKSAQPLKADSNDEDPPVVKPKH